MKRLILQNHLALGDIVMLTAAVRDLHLRFPRQYQTDVRTSCPEIWENNPFVTPIPDCDPTAEFVACSYPLINESNELPYHCIHGFSQFLGSHLGIDIRPTAFRGDIHLSEQEKAWHSQVREVTGSDIPYWIIAAGGKYDMTIKWWSADRYQAVVDRFEGKIQFVQVGAQGHYHPKLRGAIDLRGQTNLRELIRLVYHSQGVLCGVTALMHLAAAVPLKAGTFVRPCVVVAGGREPVHWAAYPEHQFISTNGALPCCTAGGCWKARTIPLGDGDERDKPSHLCVDVFRTLPRCMHMISSEEVCRRIELYFEGGSCRYLTRRERDAGRIGLLATQTNAYDSQPLTIHNARLACERFASQIPAFPGNRFRGRGIVICAGGIRYLPAAWVCINMLRRLGCKLPIELWHLGPEEMDNGFRQLVQPLAVECIDAFEVARRHPVRRLGGWELKPYAIVNSNFREILYLDADNVPVRNPETLFSTEQYRETGAIFWPDYPDFNRSARIWKSCGLARPPRPEFESGQIVTDKRRCWRSLRLALWFNENSDFYYQHLHGDKETFHIAFHKLRKSYGFVDTPAEPLLGTMCQHDFEGRRIFQHRNTDKWNIFLSNTRVPGFLFEEECRDFLKTLQEKWDGGTARYLKNARPSVRRGIVLRACMISCEGRDGLRRATLENLAATDWGEEPLHLQIDAESDPDPGKRQTRTAFKALTTCLQIPATHILFLEDDLLFNRFFRHNLLAWAPLKENLVTAATLYNPNLRPLAAHPRKNFTLVSPEIIYGSQALVIAKTALKYILDHWEEIEGNQDLKIARLAGRLRSPMFLHSPSLVQHMGKMSLWGGHFHQARDFDPDWRAPA